MKIDDMSNKVDITLLLIRHGKTVFNIERRYMGQTDLELTDEGREEIKQIFEDKTQGPGAVLASFFEEGMPLFSSPMKRCLGTAQTILPGRTFKAIADLKEMDFGDFEGKTWAELEKQDDYRAFIESSGRIAPPNGEAREDFIRRVWGGVISCCDEIRERGFNKGILVIHGGTIMALMSYLDKGSYYDYLPSNGHGYLIRLDKDRGLVSYERV